MKNDGLIGHGTNTTLSDFDLARVQKPIDNVKAGLDDHANKAVAPADIVTNDLIDKSITLK